MSDVLLNIMSNAKIATGFIQQKNIVKKGFITLSMITNRL